jgi:hypothetical protein
MRTSPSSTLPATTPAAPLTDDEVVDRRPRPTPSGQRGAIGSLWRIREFVRPYYTQLIYSVLAALLGVAAGITVPLVIRRVVDGPLLEDGVVTAADRSSLV